MVVSLAIEPVSTGAAYTMDFRHRPQMGERTLLQDSTQNAPASSRAGDRAPPHPFEKKKSAAEVPAEPERSRTSDFAAAVIAGALAPTPQSMEELLRRIGSAEIPDESMARLRDIIA